MLYLLFCEACNNTVQELFNEGNLHFKLLLCLWIRKHLKIIELLLHSVFLITFIFRLVCDLTGPRQELEDGIHYITIKFVFGAVPTRISKMMVVAGFRYYSGHPKSHKHVGVKLVTLNYGSFTGSL